MLGDDNTLYAFQEAFGSIDVVLDTALLTSTNNGLSFSRVLNNINGVTAAVGNSIIVSGTTPFYSYKSNLVDTYVTMAMTGNFNNLSTSIMVGATIAPLGDTKFNQVDTARRQSVG